MSRSFRDSHQDESLERVLSDLPAAEQEGLREAWALAGDAAPVDPATRARVWAGVQQRMAPPVPQPFRLRLLPRPVVYRFAAVAAAVVLFVSAGVLTSPSDSIYRVAEGASIASITLPDGSVVDLAPDTELRVAPQFGREHRDVSLTGEAFFDVTSAASQGGLSFRIETFNSTVEVIGTAFNVRSRKSDWERSTRVAVEHGVVSVIADQQPVRVEPGQVTRVQGTAAPAVPTAAVIERETAWREGGYAFDAVPMGAVFKELERRFALRIEAPEAIRRVEVSYWKVEAASVQEVLSDLADVVDAEIRRNASGYEVYQPER